MIKGIIQVREESKHYYAIIEITTHEYIVRITYSTKGECLQIFKIESQMSDAPTKIGILQALNILQRYLQDKGVKLK